MRIFIFTGLTPTEDNYKGPSAMMYHFIKNRPENCSILLFSLNGNKVEKGKVLNIERSLGIKIVLLRDSIYNFFHKRAKFENFRMKVGIDDSYNLSNYRLEKNHIQQITEFNPDFTWVYSSEYTKVIKQLSCYPLLVAGYDCFTLHYQRLLQDSYTYKDQVTLNRVLYRHLVALKRERDLIDIKCKYFDVGIADRDVFELITGRCDALFIPHPHYNLIDKKIDLSKDTLSVLISGAYDSATWTDVNKLVSVLSNRNNELFDNFSFTFLGKTWGPIVSQLKESGIKVQHIDWVDKYSEEIIKHDIQIIPISVGSGTKGKALDSLSMGLLTIGSKTALENIYVKHGHSCLEYSDVSEIPDMLSLILRERKVAQTIAENGLSQVRKWHNPRRIMKIICSIMTESNAYNGVIEYNEVVSKLVSLI